MKQQKMSETRILVRLLRMYFPRNWEFGSALSKLRNFGGGGLNPPNPPPGYASADSATYKLTTEILNDMNNKLLVGGNFCDLEKVFVLITIIYYVN
jgi:hypothetical protein